MDPKFGLTGEDFPERTLQFGDNFRPSLVAKPFYKLFWQALDDFMLKVLICASIFSIVFDMLLASPDHKKHAWIEGAAIMVAVLLVAGVGSFVDWKKEVSFVKSRAKSEEKNVCAVLRNGEVKIEHHNFLHVGDIINVEYGMAIPVDGIVLQATQLTVDESAMTGESDEMKKEILKVCKSRLNDLQAEAGKLDGMEKTHALPSPLILSGTNVAGGEGKFMCLMVGGESCLGQIIAKLVVTPEVTPLQQKLEEIATDIGKGGTYVALLIVHVLLLRYFAEGLDKRNTDLFGGESPCIITKDVDGNDVESGFCGEVEELFTLSLKKWLGYLIVGVAVIVVAVPEGLPLAVMISLAYSISKMLEDNNDVKRLSSCEIMGGADNICSDKTGTLTLNMMKVTKIYAGRSFDIPQEIDDATGLMTKI